MRRLTILAALLCSAWAFGGRTDLRNLATYTRAGTAYKVTPDGMTSVSADVARTRPTLVTGAPTVTYPSTVIPWCKLGSTLYGTDRTDASKVMTSTDGTNWTRIATHPGNTIIGLYSLSNGRLLAFTATPKIAYSDDGGATWSDATVPVGYLGAPLSSVGENGSGTVSFGCYNGSDYNTEKQIWTSTDWGATWQKTLSIESGSAASPYVRHIHHVTYHAGTGTWWADTGDTYYKSRRTYTSTDAMVWTWQGYVQGAGPDPNSNSITGQVVGAYPAMSDTESLVFAADSLAEIGRFAPDTLTYGTLLDTIGRSRVNTYHNVWSLGLWGGLYWASGECQSADPNYDLVQLWAAPELFTPRVTAYRGDVTADVNMAGTIFVGTDSAGRAHWQTICQTTNRRHMIVAPVSYVSVTDATVLEPALQNFCTAAVAACSSTTGWTSSGTLSAPASGGIAGGAHIRAVRTATAYNTYVSANAPFSTGLSTSTNYLAIAWVRGDFLYCEARAKMQISGGTGQSYSTLVFAAPRYDGGWMRVICPFTTDGSQTEARIDIAAYPNQATYGLTLDVGAFEIVPLPGTGEWTPGAGTSTADAYAISTTTPERWTYLLSCTLPNTSREYGYDVTGKHYLRSFVIDASNHVDLYLDTGSGVNTWTLDNVASGSSTGTITLGQRWLPVNQSVRLAVTYTGSGFDLSVTDGQAVEHAASTLASALDYSTAAVTIKAGDSAGANILPHLTAQEYLYSSAMDSRARGVLLADASAADIEYYVGTTGSDAVTGTTGMSASTPWLTLGYGYDHADAGSTVNVAAGTYSATVALDGNKDLTFQGAGQGSTILTHATGNIISLATGAYSGLVTFKDLSLTLVGTTAYVVYGNSTSDVSLALENVTINLPASYTSSYAMMMVGTPTTGRTFSWSGGALTIGGQAATTSLLYFRGASLAFADVALPTDDTANLRNLITTGAEIPLMTFRGLTGKLGGLALNTGSGSAASLIYCEDNNVICGTFATGGTAGGWMQWLSPSIVDAPRMTVLLNNTFSGWNDVIFVADPNSAGVGGGQLVAIGNTLTCRGGTGTSKHILGPDTGMDSAYKDGNACFATAGLANVYAIPTKAKHAVVSNNVVDAHYCISLAGGYAKAGNTDPNNYQSGAVVTNNTCRVNATNGIALQLEQYNGSVAGSESVKSWPVDWQIYGNVFDAAGVSGAVAVRMLTTDAAPDEFWSGWIDNNTYVAGATYLANIGGTTCTTLGELQNAWDTAGSGAGRDGNDDHSTLVSSFAFPSTATGADLKAANIGATLSTGTTGGGRKILGGGGYAP